MTLDQIQLYQTVQIKSVHCSTSFKHQLQCMGIIVHARITLIFKPPFHNPFIFRIDSTVFALRIEDAQNIEVWL